MRTLAFIMIVGMAACSTKGDGDGDGFPELEDCVDWDPAINPDAAEVCDGVDNNCDGYTDHEWAEDATTWYIDYDGDGHGSDAYVLVDCERPDGYVGNDDDCVDWEPGVYPGAIELCDESDNDCDGEIDEDAPGAVEWYLDADHDGCGTATDLIVSCVQPTGYVSQANDCDDGDPDIHSGAVELCDERDNDCDGESDEHASDALIWYLDADGDGYGEPLDSVMACSAPEGRVDDDGDCDDSRPDVNPGQDEVCEDSLDNDCDDTDNGCAPSGAIALDDVDVSLRGAVSYDNAGRAVSAAGDQDGDGLGDVLIGVPWSDEAGEATGLVALFRGPLASVEDLDSPDAVLYGTITSGAAGGAVCNAGDVNGDGYEDLGIGAPTATSLEEAAGVTYLLLGPVTGALELSEADARLRGVEPDGQLGTALAGPGDLDGDGWLDLLIGAPGSTDDGDDSGSALLVVGPVTGAARISAVSFELYGYGAGALAGRDVAAPGDLDGDGTPDLLIGAPGDEAGGSYAGAAYVVSGPVEEDLSLSHDGHALRGEHEGDGAGWSVAGVGDQDGDGYADLLVGAYGADGEESDSGVVYLMRGPVRAVTDLSGADGVLNGSESRAYSGYEVAGPGDIDRDGYTDLVVGARGSDLGATDSGATFLLYGPVTGTSNLEDAEAIFTGVGAGDLSGTSLSGGGDTDGDGYADLLIGAPAADGESASSGAAWLVLGSGL